jgi:hypothetical protein
MAGIKIIKAEGVGIAFQPDRPGAQPGQPLGANEGDLITWNNMTDDTVNLVSVPAGTPITGPIPAGSVSSPIFQVPATGLTYSCVEFPQAQHKIVVVTGTA